MRIPFDETGGKCVFSSEWDKHAVKTYSTNFNEGPHGDITKIAASTIPPHDILLAGFPCQPFSRAGLQKGFADTRGSLFFEITRIARHHKPKVVVLENVKGFLRHDDGKTFQTAKRALEALGYCVYHTILNAKDFGLPQHRERVYIVAVHTRKLRGKQFVFPVPPYTPTRISTVLQKRVASIYTISNSIWKRLQERKQREKERGNGFGYRLFLPSAPFINTIIANYGKCGSDLLIAQKHKNPRLLTPREVARLQGFPDTFIIPVSDSQAYKQFGNAVAVPVIQAITREVVKMLL